MKVMIDGLVFENTGQIGIWRIFYETMTRLNDGIDFTLWLRQAPRQPLPTGIRMFRDEGRWIGPRWKALTYLRKKHALRTVPKGLSKDTVFHTSYFTDCPLEGAPYVVSVYDMIGERMNLISGGASWITNIQDKKRTIHQATLCLAISEATAADLRLFYPEVKDRIRVATLGTEHLTRPQVGALFQTSERPYALFVGHRDGYKNILTVIDALASPAWPRDVSLHVVGTPLADYEWQLLQALGVRDRVQSLGRLSDEQLQRQYANAACFIFPSRLEGFGLPILEAQINRCPTVISDIPVFREVAGESSLYFDPRLGEQLAAAVARVREPEIRRSMIERGLENASRFSWNRTAELTRAVYEEAAMLMRR